MSLSRKLVIFGGIFIGLIAVALYLGIHGRPTAPTVTPFENVDTSKIKRIVIQNAVSTTTLELNGNVWQLATPVNDLADPNAIYPMLDALKNLSVGSVLSEKEANYPQYGLSEVQSTHLIVTTEGTDKAVLDGYIGKAATGYETCYFRFKDSKEVRLASGLSPYFFQRAPNDLRLRKVFPTACSLSTGLTIAGKNNFSASLSSATWTDSSKKVVDTAWMKTLLDKSCALSAMDFSTEEAPAVNGLDKPFMTIEISSGTEKSTLHIGKKLDPKAKPGTYYAQLQGRNALFVLNGVAIDDITTYLKPKKK